MVTEHYRESTEYAQIGENLIRDTDSLKWMLTLQTRVGYVESSRQKKIDNKLVFGECIKVEELQQVFCPYDFLIVIYAPNVRHMTEEQKRILLHHELLHCGFNTTKKGISYKVNAHDFEDFREIIFNHGLEWAR